jgi:fatty-acyl-CoA synthase
VDETLSWAKGRDDPPLLETTIGQALDEAAEHSPEAEAVVSLAQGLRWSWR